MKLLTFEQIKEITVGALNVFQTENGIYFSKCTQKQIDSWQSILPDLSDCAKCTTGVRLDFSTDSKNVFFTLSKGTFEIYINSKMDEQICNNDNVIEISKTLPEGENRVTLYLPSHTVGVLFKVGIDDDATINRHKFDKKMLFIGDSITQGWASRIDSLAYAPLVSQYFNAESVINGIGGSLYFPDFFDKISFDPDVVIIAYGTNDYNYYHDVETLEKNVYGFLKQIKEEYSQKRIFVILPIWRQDIEIVRRMGKFSDCREKIDEVAKKLGIETIDAFDFVPHDKRFYNDDLHPNELGFSVYARNLIYELKNRGV